MANIGSVFLGDVQRHRLLASSNPSTPPSSPSPISASSPPPSSISAVFTPLSQSSTSMQKTDDTISSKGQAPATIDPVLALELRIRWLEALLLGVKQQDNDRGRDKTLTPAHAQDHIANPTTSEPVSTLSRTAVDLQRRFDAVVESNDGLKRFMAHYDQHAQFLTPDFALSGSLVPDAPTYDTMSSEQLEALLVEMEPDIRAADRDMREIELLEQKGVTEPGNLAAYEQLQPRLTALLRRHQEEIDLTASLEKRIVLLMERHATHTDALSELFVAWDDTITMAEDRMNRLERERGERQRLGLESDLEQ